MQKIAITGATGLVGSRIVKLLKDDFTFFELSHTLLDITNKHSVSHALESLEFDLLVHCAGYTQVDLAEHERDQAYNLNVLSTMNLFEKCTQYKKKFIYISTDFVFDGKNPPYDESSTPHPLGHYGKTKYEAEQILISKNLKLHTNAMIVRISYPYRNEFAKKKDFVRSIKTLLETHKEIRAIIDSTITPTFIDDIALGLRYLIRNFKPEIYHLVGPQSISPYEAITTIAKVFNLDSSLIKPILFTEYYKNNIIRPQFSTIKSTLNDFQTMRKLQETLMV